MSIKKTLGGDRLGSGKKMQVEMHGFERSNHDLGYLWRTTMSAGTLVPFMSEVGLPGDSWDIHLEMDIKTHPTVGPLFGSFKAQADVFSIPIRLYHAWLHNNKLNIGLNMSQVKLPVWTAFVNAWDDESADPSTVENSQINPSSLLKYLGFSGIGRNNTGARQSRDFNAAAILAYFDVFKNYYSNKQEQFAYQIITPNLDFPQTVDEITINGTTVGSVAIDISAPGAVVNVTFTNNPKTDDWAIMLSTNIGLVSLEYFATKAPNQTGLSINYAQRYYVTGNITVFAWSYLDTSTLPRTGIQLKPFQLTTIDDMREEILKYDAYPVPFSLNGAWVTDDPFYNMLNWTTVTASPYMGSQNGLVVKTYQSDLFNNWLNTESIDGNTGINEITKVPVVADAFTIDSLQLSKKVYDMLNRIAVSGGTYHDWIEATYDHTPFSRVETPVYHGSLIKELVFQEVVSNTESPSSNGTIQPLGTLAGKGVMSQKHKGGNITIKCDEHCYIMGIVSLTPRVDYSQGNKWDVNLKTMDDFHKPPMDQIGFQELPTEWLAWWETIVNDDGTVTMLSAGKQPAWVQYMTNVNKTFGNFAVPDNEMFMTLNRRYSYNQGGIGDLTTYIDPAKFNNIFADTALDSQNFWVQMAIDANVRRKMSAKLMPNL